MLARRLASIILVSFKALINIYGIWLIYTTRAERRKNRKSTDRIEILLYVTSLVFILHAPSSIVVSMMFQNGTSSTMRAMMLSFMGFSCFSNLVYMVLTLYPMTIHLVAMNLHSFTVRVITYTVVSLICISKLYAVVVLFLGLGTGLSLTRSMPGIIAGYSNTAGNALYAIYAVFSAFTYSKFLYKFLGNRIAVSGDEEQMQKMKSIRISIHLWNILVTSASITSVVMCVLGMQGTHHTIAVSVNGLAAAFFHLYNVWLDAFLLVPLKSTMSRRQTMTASGMKSVSGIHSHIGVHSHVGQQVTITAAIPNGELIHSLF